MDGLFVEIGSTFEYLMLFIIKCIQQQYQNDEGHKGGLTCDPHNDLRARFRFYIRILD